MLHAVSLEMFCKLVSKLWEMMLPSFSVKSFSLCNVMIFDLLDSFFLNMIATRSSEKMAPLYQGRASQNKFLFLPNLYTNVLRLHYPSNHKLNADAVRLREVSCDFNVLCGDVTIESPCVWEYLCRCYELAILIATRESRKEPRSPTPPNRPSTYLLLPFTSHPEVSPFFAHVLCLSISLPYRTCCCCWLRELCGVWC